MEIWWIKHEQSLSKWPNSKQSMWMRWVQAVVDDRQRNYMKQNVKRNERSKTKGRIIIKERKENLFFYFFWGVGGGGGVGFVYLVLPDQSLAIPNEQSGGDENHKEQSKTFGTLQVIAWIYVSPPVPCRWRSAPPHSYFISKTYNNVNFILSNFFSQLNSFKLSF